MNYYEQHIGDYAKDAGHLSMVEDGAYRRLLDAYYTREEALPADVKACCKLARASTKPERDAVAYVLGEFFTLTADGYHQKRCDEEIARFKDKQAKARRSANARWNRGEETSASNANACPDEMRTHSEWNAPRARPHTPVTNHQTQSTGETHTLDAPRVPARAREDAPSATPEPTEAGRACRLMRDAGCATTNPANPNLLEALAEGVTPETLAQYAALAVANGKTSPFAYAIAAARGDHRQPQPGARHAHGTPHRRLSAVERVEANIRRRRIERGELDPGDVIDGEATRIPR